MKEKVKKIVSDAYDRLFFDGIEKDNVGAIASSADVLVKVVQAYLAYLNVMNYEDAPDSE